MDDPGCGPNAASRRAEVKPLKRQIFEHVRAAGQISRRDLARALAVSPGSVTSLTADLIEHGLLSAISGEAVVHTTRGRPAVALRLAPHAGHVVGMKLSDVRHSAVVVTFAGAVIAEASAVSQGGAQHGETLVEEAAGLLGAVLEKAALHSDDISALGVGLAGIVDHSRGIVPWSPMFRDRNVGLRDLLAARTGLPVHIDNDANVLTLAELWFGAGRSKSSFAVITVESGVGMGLVVENRLDRGALGMGMELGHTKVHLDGALCRCGRNGCLEAYLADYALVRDARVALNLPHTGGADMAETLAMLYAQAQSGHAAAEAVLRRAGRYLAIAMSNVTHLFDPEVILLSGGGMSYDYLYSDQILAEMEALTLENGRGRCGSGIQRLGRSGLGAGGGGLGLVDGHRPHVRRPFGMIWPMVILFSLLGDPTPRFEPRDMPVNHVYLGGWEHFVGGGVAVFDCDDNGLPDMAAAGGEAPMRLFRNITGPDSRIAFEEVPVTQITGVTGAYPLDIDSDGIRDLVVLRVGPNEILRGLGNCRFERAAWHIPKGDAWTTAFSATWEAGRDWPTLAFGNYVDRSDPDGPFEACDDNILLRHDGSDYTEQPLTPGFCALSMLFSDWNGSGIADLRVSNDRHYYVRGGSEQMWRMPDLTLRDGDGWEPVSIWGMGIASRDLNGDGASGSHADLDGRSTASVRSA